jgi:hypothetical protein
VLLTTGFGWLSSLVLAEDFFFGRKLKNRCCLPSHDYASDGFSNPVSGRSLTVLKSTASGRESTTAVSRLTAGNLGNDDAGLGDLKVFQIRPSSLAVDHCEVTKLTVTLATSGAWFLSCSATQNPARLDAARRTEFEKFLRNEFRLQIRPVVLALGTGDAETTGLGVPEIDSIEDQTFWVQKGETRRLALRGTSDTVAQLIEQIETVIVHFSYR